MRSWRQVLPHTLTLTSTRIIDDRAGLRWGQRLSGGYKLAIFYVNPSPHPSFPGEWVGQALSTEVTSDVTRER